MKLSFSTGLYQQRTHGTKPDPAWPDVEAALRKAAEETGQVVLTADPLELQFFSENGLHLMHMGDGEEVRSYTNPAAPAELVYVLGDQWDARGLCDFDVVLTAFRQFLETGDVSRDILDD